MSGCTVAPYRSGASRDCAVSGRAEVCAAACGGAVAACAAPTVGFRLCEAIRYRVVRRRPVGAARAATALYPIAPNVAPRCVAARSQLAQLLQSDSDCAKRSDVGLYGGPCRSGASRDRAVSGRAESCVAVCGGAVAAYAAPRVGFRLCEAIRHRAVRRHPVGAARAATALCPVAPKVASRYVVARSQLTQLLQSDSDCAERSDVGLYVDPCRSGVSRDCAVSRRADSCAAVCDVAVAACAAPTVGRRSHAAIRQRPTRVTPVPRASARSPHPRPGPATGTRARTGPVRRCRDRALRRR